MRALFALAVAAFAACSADSGTNAPPPSVSLTLGVPAPGLAGSHAISLALNDTVRLQYSLLDIFGNPALAPRPTFVSRHAGIASVSSAGLIRARGAGRTHVVGLAQGVNGTLSDSIAVTVTVVCTLEARPGIVIIVEDSVTGSRGPFSAVSYVARDGAYRDSSFFNVVTSTVGPGPFEAGLAYERPGTYDVTVRASGYAAWVKPGVVVTKDACHVIPVNLLARLIR